MDERGSNKIEIFLQDEVIHIPICPNPEKTHFIDFTTTSGKVKLPGVSGENRELDGSTVRKNLTQRVWLS